VRLQHSVAFDGPLQTERRLERRDRAEVKPFSTDCCAPTLPGSGTRVPTGEGDDIVSWGYAHNKDLIVAMLADCRFMADGGNLDGPERTKRDLPPNRRMGANRRSEMRCRFLNPISVTDRRHVAPCGADTALRGPGEVR
jgi:hypothetical protein